MGERKRNRLGSISLAAAIGGFLVVELQPWLALASVALFGGLSLKGLLEAFFAASMAGAFADWYAVTALFKDPLGIRLPHTNILAKNKDAIADAIPRFLTGFVNSRAISDELGKIDYASKAAEALSAGGSREELHSFLRIRAAELLSAYGGGDANKSAVLRRFVDEILGFVSENVDAPAEATVLLSWARKEGFDERAVEAIAEYVRLETGRNRVRLVAILTPLIRRNAGWQGLFIGAGTVDRFLVGIQEELSAIKADKANELRRYILASISTYADELAGDGFAKEELSKAFREVLAGEGFRRGFALFVAQFLSRLGEDLSGVDGRFIPSLERVENALVARLSGDAELRAGFNSMVASLIGGVLERGRVVEGITEYLSKLLRSTDERYFVEKIEESVGDDLQYIRVNGAVVGGLVGLAMAIIKAALSI
ncbi:MAG: DUF445 domain-containing protein [Rectinemataceae bacterium]|jgi:uncharacterized membrane-anchored protein YjiN (DUF445 family)